MSTTTTRDIEQYRTPDSAYDLTDGQGVYAGTEHTTILRMHPDFDRDGEARYQLQGTRMYRPIQGMPMVQETPRNVGGITLEEATRLAAQWEATYAAAAYEAATRDEDVRLGRWTLNGRPVKEGRSYSATTRYGGYRRVSFTYLDDNTGGSMPAGEFNGKIRCRRCSKSARACKCGEGAQ